MDFSELKHTRRQLKEGGRVVVLDTGALITPEATAMLQALHSRSIGGIDSHLEKLAKKGAADFMSTYYVGYGDRSIGDCGTTTLFIEGVSLLAAKAIQDSQLYNGQESSTRYIDFSKQLFLNPLGTEEGAKLLESLRTIHLEGLEIMKAELAVRHPRQDDEDEKVWKKAINARAFDVMRSFLPAGAVTNLAWHTELRHANDHLLRLRNHPLEEVREIAETAGEALNESYPSSFHHKRYEATESYTRAWMEDLYYFDFEDVEANASFSLSRDGIDIELLKKYESVLSTRPIKTEPPKFLAECGQMQFSFLFDFGSFRDMQRHRALIQRMPLLSTKWGFEPWYLEQMPKALCEKAEAFIAAYEEKLASINMPPLVAQYYVPMGYRVACRVTGDLPALIWFVEIRSGISAHPTVRTIALKMAEHMQTALGPQLVLHIDQSEDRFNFKRGLQDIVEKTT